MNNCPINYNINKCSSKDYGLTCETCVHTKNYLFNLTANCPYCNAENKFEDEVSNYPTYDTTCVSCGKEFRLRTIWKPQVSVEQIEYKTCIKCKKETTYFEMVDGEAICYPCHLGF